LTVTKETLKDGGNTRSFNIPLASV
jgi:hypothetical protein